MEKRRYSFLLLIPFFFFLFASSVSYAEEKTSNEELDVSNGWTIDFSTSFPNIEKDQVFIQNHINQSLKQKMLINNFANIGDAELTAKKSIFMKKGYEYTINLIYAMQFEEAQRGWIDFNGDKVYSEIESYPSDKEYKKKIVPKEDFVYTITIHYEVKKMENGYLKLGYLMDNEGIEATPEPLNSTVTVRYLGEEGQPLAENEVITGKVGESYSVPIKEMKGYSLKETQGELSGAFSVEPQEVTLIYAKNPVKDGMLTVYYRDEAGNDIDEPMIKKGLIDTEYQVKGKAINGYILKEVQGEQTGTFKTESQSIIYIYEKVENKAPESTVTIYYQDENGKELAEHVVKKSVVGELYDVDIKEIPEYTLKEINDEHFGKYVEKNQIVRCVYIKKEINNSINQASFKNVKQMPALGESDKVLLQVIGITILGSVLFFSFVKKLRK